LAAGYFAERNPQSLYPGIIPSPERGKGKREKDVSSVRRAVQSCAGINFAITRNYSLEKSQQRRTRRWQEQNLIASKCCLILIICTRAQPLFRVRGRVSGIAET